jgi:hypothetical protein
MPGYAVHTMASAHKRDTVNMARLSSACGALVRASLLVPVCTAMLLTFQFTEIPLRKPKLPIFLNENKCMATILPGP